jgi:hypothetical protein
MGWFSLSLVYSIGWVWQLCCLVTWPSWGKVSVVLRKPSWGCDCHNRPPMSVGDNLWYMVNCKLGTISGLSHLKRRQSFTDEQSRACDNADVSWYVRNLHGTMHSSTYWVPCLQYYMICSAWLHSVEVQGSISRGQSYEEFVSCALKQWPLPTYTVCRKLGMY